jgi:cellulose synthase (UDP-forming)
MTLIEERVEPLPAARPRVAAWAERLGAPAGESPASRRWAHLGGLAAATAVALYLTWRIGFTLPTGIDLLVTLPLVAFEAVPLLRLGAATVLLWRLDGGPTQPGEAPADLRVAVLIPTYDEPVEVLAPTIAAACALDPAHETFVLDDSDRGWVAELCESLGARYLSRQVHDHDKAGNLNYALAVLSAEDVAGVGGADVVAVLDSDHVPLATFLTSTLGWFADEKVAVVQAPQVSYNAGAFDDDGRYGEQGAFFNVRLPARQQHGADVRWCGSTALLRVDAVTAVGGFSAGTVREELDTTVNLLTNGWHTVYHHQTVAVGLAPASPAAYQLQQRRRALGELQVLTRRRLWSKKATPGLSTKNRLVLLSAAAEGLRGLATLLAFLIPVAVLLSGVTSSTAEPVAILVAFAGMWALRLWGARLLLRHQVQWRTSLALSIMRIPVALASLRWLVRRDDVPFTVTPKGGSHTRRRGRIPRSLVACTLALALVLVVSLAGVTGLVPWRADLASTLAADVWLAAGLGVLLLGSLRIKSAQFATTRRNAPRIAVSTPVKVAGVPATLVDISIGGAAVSFPSGQLPDVEIVELELPMTKPIRMVLSPVPPRADDNAFASLRYLGSDWRTLQVMALWMFHTPYDAVPSLPAGTPVVAAR